MTCLLLLGLATWTPPPGAAPAPLEAFKRAEVHYHADRPASAEPLYQIALQSNDAFLVRQSYSRLVDLYIKSARPDRAIQIAKPFREWLARVDDRAAIVQLDLECAECYIALALYDRAEAALAGVQAAKQPLAKRDRMRVQRGLAEIARWLRLPSEKERWQQLETTAVSVRDEADRVKDLRLRILADSFQAEARSFRGDAAGAIKLLEELPPLHNQLGDPLGRRNTQRMRAKILGENGRYAEAAPLFSEAIELHKKVRPALRLPVGDLLADWSTAAHLAGDRAEAARLRAAAAVEYQAIIAAAELPTADPNDRESPFAAFVKLQQLSRSAREFRQALNLAREADERWSGDSIVDGRISADRGMMELVSESYPVARKLLRKSLADLDAAELPDVRLIANVLVNLAAAELALSEPTEADRLVARVKAIYGDRKLPDDPVRAQAEYLAGVADLMRGGFAEAIAHFRLGQDLCDRAGPSTGTDPIRFNLWLNTALIHKEQGDVATASAALEQAAAVLKRYAEPGDISVGYIAALRADFDLELGKVPSAVLRVPEIELACKSNGVTDGFLVSTANHVRAMDLLTRGERAAAEAIWVGETNRMRKDGQLRLARALNYRGIVAELQGRTVEAKAHFEEARIFQDRKPRCPPAWRYITLWRLAVIADGEGDRDAAKRLATEVFDVADRARLQTFGEAAQRAAFYSQFNPVFEMLAGWHARDREADGLLRVIARSRSRTLLDQILVAGVDPRDRLTGPKRTELLGRETALRQTISQLRAQAQFLAADDPKAPGVIEKIEASQKDYADLWREIVNEDPVTRALTAVPDPLDSAKATAVPTLAYLVGRDASFAVLSPGGGRPAELFKLTVSEKLAGDIGDVPSSVGSYSAKRRGIVIEPIAPQPAAPPVVATAAVPLTGRIATRLVDHYLRQIADESFQLSRGIQIVPRETASAVRSMRSETLGDVLIPPELLDRLAALNLKRLVVIPDGALHKIPFECLALTTKNGPRFALDELPPLAYAPSPAILQAVLARPATRTDGSLLTVGDPAYGEKRPAGTAPARDGDAILFRGSLPGLPFSAEESKKIRDAFPRDRVTALLGVQATEKAVTAAMPNKQFIHLAAHGFADDRFGNLFAAIALTPPAEGAVQAENDGFLTLHEIHRLALTGCELTVLSACTTNVGPQRPLEAGVTLASAFLCAGSRRVLATCWAVDDRATSELMAHFFESIKPGQKVARSYPDALRAARLAIRNTPGWESPAFWAPFVLIGAPD